MIHSVAFRGDGKVLATGAEDRTVKLWDTATGDELKMWGGQFDVVKTVAFRAGTPTLASGGGKAARLWDTATGQELIVSETHRDAVGGVAFHPGGTLLASICDDRAVRVWDLARGAGVRTLHGHLGPVSVVAFAPAGEFLATGGRDGQVRLWETTTWTSRTVNERFFTVALAFSPDGRALAYGTGDGKVKLRDTAEWKERRVMFAEGVFSTIGALAYSPDGKTIASGSADGPIVLWDPATGSGVGVFSDHRCWLTHVAYRGDGRLVSAGTGNPARLWGPIAGKEVKQFGGGGWVTHTAFRGTTLATSSTDGAVRLWDSDSGEQLRTFRLAPPGGVVFSVAFSPDGRHFATANGNGTVYVFRLAPPPAE